MVRDSDPNAVKAWFAHVKSGVKQYYLTSLLKKWGVSWPHWRRALQSMRRAAILDFIRVMLDHPGSANGLSLVLNFGLDPIYSYGDIAIFTALHGMPARTSYTTKLPVRLSNAWFVTKRKHICPHSYTTWKIIYPSFVTWRMVGGGDPFYLKFWVRNRRFSDDIRCSASAIASSKKVQLTLIACWPCNWGIFPQVLSLVLNFGFDPIYSYGDIAHWYWDIRYWDIGSQNPSFWLPKEPSLRGNTPFES